MTKGLDYLDLSPYLERSVGCGTFQSRISRTRLKPKRSFASVDAPFGLGLQILHQRYKRNMS